MNTPADKEPDQAPDQPETAVTSKSAKLNQSLSTLIDYSSYANPEFSERIAELLSVKETIRSIYRTAFLFMFFVILLMIYLFYGRVSLTYVFAVLGYGVPVTAALGFYLGVLITLNRSLDSIVKLLEIMLQTTGKVAHDVSGVLSGAKQRPTMREITNGVYMHVVLPTIGKVIEKQIWFFGKLLFWLYRVTLDRAVRQFLKLIPEEQPVEHDPEMDQELTNEDLEQTSSFLKGADRWLTSGRDTLNLFGHLFRRLVVLPFLMGWIIALVVVYGPIAYLWLYAI